MKIAFHPDKVRTYIMQRISQSKADRTHYLRHEKKTIPDIEQYSPEEALKKAGF